MGESYIRFVTFNSTLVYSVILIQTSVKFNYLEIFYDKICLHGLTNEVSLNKVS